MTRAWIRGAWIRGASLAVAAMVCFAIPSARAASPEDRFRAASDAMRGGDYPKAVALYDSLARSGAESASLYWNWAQAASARGALGEALWALLRARELDPSDRAVAREIERLREAANLDAAELSPEPLATAARTARQLRLDWIAVLLLALSVALHAAFRWRAARLAGLAWATLALGLVAALLPVAGAWARPLGAVVHRGAALLDAASPTSEAVGTLREGEVVPILGQSGGYIRVEDSSGARGWARSEDVRTIVARR